jgi:hypothetical protein
VPISSYLSTQTLLLCHLLTIYCLSFTIDPISPASSSTKSEEEAGVHQDLDNDEDWEEDDEADYEILSKALV